MIRKKCLICDSLNLNDIIDLGIHPFADTFISKSKLHLTEKTYPLIVQLCDECGATQLKYVTEPEDRYQDYEYSYTSSNSDYSKSYWLKYANYILKNFSIKEKLKILEIGSNDGYLLSILKKYNHEVLGVDASPKMNELSMKNNINSKLGVFNEKISQEILNEFGKFDLIIANNVLNHSDDPKIFFKGVSKLMKNSGKFIFESPYWLTSIQSGKFDQIYHEHVTYLNAKWVKKISHIFELFITKIELTEYHGGSIRFILSKTEDKDDNNRIDKFIYNENKIGLYSHLFYKKFVNNLYKNRSVFMEKLIDNNSPLICIGAAAKANTFLNFYGLNNKMVNFVTDASPLKIGKFTPLTRIEIVKDEIIKNYKKPKIIFTAWNVSDNLKKLIFKLNNNYEELKPYGN